MAEPDNVDAVVGTVKRGRGRPPKNPAVVNVQTPAKKPRKLRRPRLSKVTFLVVVIILAALATSGYFYMKYRDTQNKLNNPTAESSTLVNKVGKLVELPTGETPTIATVSDVSKLSGQTFFENARNGDKVLIYSNAKKAVLYRPSTNKVINVAPLNVNNSATPNESAAPSQ